MGARTESVAEALEQEPTYAITLYILDDSQSFQGDLAVAALHLDDMQWSFGNAYLQVSERTGECDVYRPSRQQVITDAKRLVEHVEWGEYLETSEGGYSVEVNLGPAKWEAKLPMETLTRDHPVAEIVDRYYNSIDTENGLDDF